MKKTTFLIVGKHAVLEALKNTSRKIERVFLTEDAQKKLNRENQSLNLFKKVNVFYKSRKELDNLCGRDETAHQGFRRTNAAIEGAQPASRYVREDWQAGLATACQSDWEA